MVKLRYETVGFLFQSNAMDSGLVYLFWNCDEIKIVSPSFPDLESLRVPQFYAPTILIQGMSFKESFQDDLLSKKPI